MSTHSLTGDPRLSELPLLERIRAAAPTLRKSEQKVAEAVLAAPRDVLGYTMAAVADVAGVSEPTVMRFALRLGYEGFQAFKFDLAQVLAVGVPVTFSGIKPGDPVELISQTVFDHTVSSLDRARKTYDVSALNEAVDYLYSASYVTFVGFGASSIIAQDAEQKGGLFGVP